MIWLVFQWVKLEPETCRFHAPCLCLLNKVFPYICGTGQSNFEIWLSVGATAPFSGFHRFKNINQFSSSLCHKSVERDESVLWCDSVKLRTLIWRVFEGKPFGREPLDFIGAFYDAQWHQVRRVRCDHLLHDSETDRRLWLWSTPLRLQLHLEMCQIFRKWMSLLFFVFLWCWNGMLFFTPAIVNRSTANTELLLNVFTVRATSDSMVPLSSRFNTTLLYLGVSQRLCESVSYENKCKCCWFKDKYKRLPCKKKKSIFLILSALLLVSQSHSSAALMSICLVWGCLVIKIYFKKTFFQSNLLF